MERVAIIGEIPWRAPAARTVVRHHRSRHHAAGRPAVTVGSVSSDDITGLTNGTARSFTVATNAIGTGTASAASKTATPETPAPPPVTSRGYWMVTADGAVYPQGSVTSYGSASSVDLNAPIVGSAAVPGGRGYWLVAADGGIFSYGAAAFYGSMGSDHLNAPVVGMASTPDGSGYWLVAADGGVFAFGDAAFAGSAVKAHLNAPMVGIVGDGTTGGYWLVAADGGIFSYGNAPFYGSTGGENLNAPIVGGAATPEGHGYWLVAADGGVFSFGSPLPGISGWVHLRYSGGGDQRSRRRLRTHHSRRWGFCLRGHVLRVRGGHGTRSARRRHRELSGRDLSGREPGSVK